MNIVNSDIHFICIDKKCVDPVSNKTFIILEKGERIIFPEGIVQVPALLLLNANYNVLYGDDIIKYFHPAQQKAIAVSTQNNMEPTAFMFNSNGFSDVVSDNYSFLDQDVESLSAKGDGGIRQMHNYVSLYDNHNSINTPEDEVNYKGSNKLSNEVTIETLQKQRDADFNSIIGNKQRPF